MIESSVSAAAGARRRVGSALGLLWPGLGFALRGEREAAARWLLASLVPLAGSAALIVLPLLPAWIGSLAAAACGLLWPLHAAALDATRPEESAATLSPARRGAAWVRVVVLATVQLGLAVTGAYLLAFRITAPGSLFLVPLLAGIVFFWAIHDWTRVVTGSADFMARGLLLGTIVCAGAGLLLPMRSRFVLDFDPLRIVDAGLVERPVPDETPVALCFPGVSPPRGSAVAVHVGGEDLLQGRRPAAWAGDLVEVDDRQIRVNGRPSVTAAEGLRIVFEPGEFPLGRRARIPAGRGLLLHWMRADYDVISDISDPRRPDGSIRPGTDFGHVTVRPMLIRVVGIIVRG